MDYSQGYTSSFYMTLLDPITWTDTGRIELISGSISRTETDLRQSADLTVRNWDYDSDQWIRVYMVADSKNDLERTPLFTGIATSPSDSYEHKITTSSVQAYSVLKPAQDIVLQHGWFAKKNTNCEDLIRDLLSDIHAPIVFNYNGEVKRLEDDIIAEDSETEVSMVEKILYAVDWVMYIRGDGTIVIESDHSSYNDTTDAIITMSSYENDVIETSFTINHDWFNCPNVLRATINEMTAIAKDEDPESPLSIQNRGREIWVTEDNVDLLDNETIAEYAMDKLREYQERSETVSYNRRYLPNVNVTNKVRLSYKELNGDFIVTSQNITLGHAAVTQEEIRRSV